MRYSLVPTNSAKFVAGLLLKQKTTTVTSQINNDQAKNNSSGKRGCVNSQQSRTKRRSPI